MCGLKDIVIRIFSATHCVRPQQPSYSVDNSSTKNKNYTMITIGHTSSRRSVLEKIRFNSIMAFFF